MSVSTGAGAATMFTLPAMQEELRVLRNMVQLLARQRESDVRISEAERNLILSAISDVRQDIVTLPILEREMRALQMTVAGLQAEVRTRH